MHKGIHYLKTKQTNKKPNPLSKTLYFQKHVDFPQFLAYISKHDIFFLPFLPQNITLIY